MINDKLNARTMLVSLKIGQPPKTKADKAAAVQLVVDNAADVARAEEAFAVRQVLLSKDLFSDCTAAVSAARNYHRDNTLPWLDIGARIITAEHYLAYRQQMQAFEAEYLHAADAFVAAYPFVREDAERRLGKAFSAHDFPSVEEIQRRFYFEVKASSLGDAEDFRADLPDDILEEIRAEITSDTNAALRDATAHAFQRMHDAIAHMNERLSAFKIDATTGKRSGVFRDSLVENIAELAAVLPALNVARDPELDRMARAMLDKLTKHDGDTLRDSEVARQETLDATAELLGEMANFRAVA